jgi:hypothetical protein
MEAEQLKEIGQWAVGIGSTIAAFFFGKSGILQKFVDSRIKRVEAEQQKDSQLLAEYKSDNKSLQELVKALTQKVSTLESELSRTNERLLILVAYFEKVKPGDDAFIDKIIEISKQKNNG